jgi:hypothetical protein
MQSRYAITGVITIKGLIKFENLKISENIKLLIGHFNKQIIKYDGKEVMIYKIPAKFKKSISNKLTAEIKKNNIKDILVETDNENYVNILSSEFYIINCKKIMLNLIDKIIKSA